VVEINAPYPTGVSQLNLTWRRRRRRYVASIHVTVAKRECSRVAQVFCFSMQSNNDVQKKLSASSAAEQTPEGLVHFLVKVLV
jgi:hypothetical protein